MTETASVMTDGREAKLPPASELSDSVCWAAVFDRDVRYDGHFYYAVASTKIYCRPSCPARRPHRDRVSYFASPAEAKASGFRPCKRCRPDDVAPTTTAMARITQVCRLIEASESPPRLASLAASVGLSPSHLHRQFKATLGVTPNAYAAAIRDDRVRSALARGASVTEALYEAGFGSSSRFYAGAKDALGMTPGRRRTGGAGEQIVYAIAPCALGRVLVAASGTGVCAIYLGDGEEALRDALTAQFPRASLAEAPSDFAETVAAVVALVDAPEVPCALPLDIRGTAFQRRVWDALRRIRPGTTKSYADIAAEIRTPGSVRAVAGACAANRLAVAIPCHRVVRSDGALSGYRWGVDRKRALLAKETK